MYNIIIVPGMTSAALLSETPFLLRSSMSKYIPSVGPATTPLGHHFYLSNKSYKLTQMKRALLLTINSENFVCVAQWILLYRIL